MTPPRPKLLKVSLLAFLAFAGALRAEKIPGTPLPAPAPAEGGGPGNRMPGRPSPELMRRYDRNGDGQIDAGEQKAARADLAKMDARRPEGPLRAEVLARFDRDGDGRLDDAERAEFERARAEYLKQPPGGNAKARERLLKQFDRDGDGRLNAGEEAAARAAMQRRGAGKKARP